MTDGSAPARPAGQRWKRWLSYALGIAVLAIVVSKVHWRDSAVLADGTELVGEIVGETPRTWDAASRVTFRPVEGAERELAAADLERDSTGPVVNEGLIRIVRRSDKWKLLAGLLLFGAVTHVGILRWWMLLRAQDIRIPFSLARRLTFLGFFFNNVVPGPTGGDIVKAVYAARQTGRRAQAVVTVLIDRIAGIIALALIAASVLVFRLDDPKYHELAVFIGLFLGGIALAGMLFFSRRVRRLIRFESWSAKLPLGTYIRQADEAVFLWRGHKTALLVALVLSFANQLCVQGIMVLFGGALHIATAAGEPLGWGTYMAVLPVAFIVSALPVLPGGWGIREAAFVGAFGLVGVERNPALALSVLNGIMQLAWSLPGGVFFLADRSAGSAPRSPDPPGTSTTPATPAENSEAVS